MTFTRASDLREAPPGPTVRYRPEIPCIEIFGGDSRYPESHPYTILADSFATCEKALYALAHIAAKKWCANQAGTLRALAAALVSAARDARSKP